MRRGFALFAARRARAERGGCCAIVTNRNGNRPRLCKRDAVTEVDALGDRYCGQHEDQFTKEKFAVQIEKLLERL